MIALRKHVILRRLATEASKDQGCLSHFCELPAVGGPTGTGRLLSCRARLRRSPGSARQRLGLRRQGALVSDPGAMMKSQGEEQRHYCQPERQAPPQPGRAVAERKGRSEEHTSELQSRGEQ